MNYSKNTNNIDNDVCYNLLSDFARTKEASIELFEIVKKLIRNKLSNNKYRNLTNDEKQDLTSQAILEFLQYAHNFKPKETYSKGIAVGYLNYNMENTFNRYLKKLYKKQKMEVNIEFDISFWNTNFDYGENYESRIR